LNSLKLGTSELPFLDPGCVLGVKGAKLMELGDLHRRATVFTHPDDMKWLCSLHGLVSLTSEVRMLGLPECLGAITSLVRIDVRANQFGAKPDVVPSHMGLPPSLSKLTNMVDFVGFSQSDLKCPLGGSSRKGKVAALVKNDAPDCRPTYLYKAAVKDKNPSDYPWQCKSRGWHPKFDDLSQPFWAWKKMEKFWVDANFFQGSIPHEIATKWPKLRSLDLYNNDLTGTIPESLRKLTLLNNLQLQDNKLSGTVPSDLWGLNLLNTLHLSMNPELGGDLKRGMFEEAVSPFSLLRGRKKDARKRTCGLQLSLQYTNININDEDDEREF
jgi:hypothetical protein